MKHNMMMRSALLLLGSLIGVSAADQLAEDPTPDSGFHPVDLTQHYGKRADSWATGSCWAAVPWGRRTYEGVPFECGGVMEVTGMDAARRIGDVFPGRFTDIPVGSAGEWIHVLQGVGWKEADGVTIARLKLHYTNGRTSNLQIRYGVNVRNWWKEPSELHEDLADPNSKVVWSAPNPEPVGRPTTLRLYKTSFANPHPKWVIATLDFESLFTHATPFVVAITVGGAGDGARRAKVGHVSVSDRFTQKIVVKGADSDKGVGGAQVQVTLSDGERTYSFGTQTTDAAGRTTLEFPREPVCELSLHISAPGCMPFDFKRNILDLPPTLELKLEAQAQ